MKSSAKLTRCVDSREPCDSFDYKTSVVDKSIAVYKCAYGLRRAQGTSREIIIALTLAYADPLSASPTESEARIQSVPEPVEAVQQQQQQQQLPVEVAKLRAYGAAAPNTTETKVVSSPEKKVLDDEKEVPVKESPVKEAPAKVVEEVDEDSKEASENGNGKEAKENGSSEEKDLQNIEIVNQTFLEATHISLNPFVKYKSDGIVGLAYKEQSGWPGVTPFFYNLMAQNLIEDYVFTFYMNRDATTDRAGKVLFGATARTKIVPDTLTKLEVVEPHKLWKVKVGGIFATKSKKEYPITGETYAVFDSAANTIVGPSELIKKLNYMLQAVYISGLDSSSQQV
ncbi:unnamed protein product [Trichogramma brassicae]|uniref:Peptidase A1 domain-containing protein n=1 Tax=Trichogramma brassicae TaxID=86971 RepID=A0A6H5I7X5_9HYME|nr:unnamed protein product [Trichogramma brassicae]